MQKFIVIPDVAWVRRALPRPATDVWGDRLLHVPLQHLAGRGRQEPRHCPRPRGRHQVMIEVDVQLDIKNFHVQI